MDSPVFIRPPVGPSRLLSSESGREQPQGESSLVIADAETLLCDLLCARLRPTWSPVTVAAVTTCQELVEHVMRQPRSMILANLRVADASLLELAAAVRQVTDRARIVVWADRFPHFLPPDEFFDFLPRSLTADQLEARLRSLWECSESQSRDSSPRPFVVEADEEALSSRLTRRQAEVMVMIARGLSVKQVAKELHLSTKAVDSLKYRLMKTLNMHDRVDLARLAIREGLIEP